MLSKSTNGDQTDSFSLTSEASNIKSTCATRVSAYKVSKSQCNPGQQITSKGKLSFN